MSERVKKILNKKREHDHRARPPGSHRTHNFEGADRRKSNQNNELRPDRAIGPSAFQWIAGAHLTFSHFSEFFWSAQRGNGAVSYVERNTQKISENPQKSVRRLRQSQFQNNFLGEKNEFDFFG